jgi:hypothetical protein
MGGDGNNDRSDWHDPSRRGDDASELDGDAGTLIKIKAEPTPDQL